jgi:hypothetical protein
VGALRSVFTEMFEDDPTMKDLQIVQDYNLEEIKFPLVVINFRSERTENVGVGHSELWLTKRGYEKHLRRWFEGEVTFTIYARSPTDRDKMYDALTDVLAFGRLESLLGNFFDYLYFHDVGVDYQIMLNEDQHRDLGDNTVKPWWGPEDYLIFSGGIGMDVHGTFTSVVEDPEHTLAFIHKIIVYPYIFGYEDAPDPEPLVVEWLGTSNSEDNAYVRGEGVVSSIEEYTPSP